MLQVLIHLPQQCLLLLVRGYRLLLKPWLGNACRFEPTCSQYALDALQRHGAAGGALLTTARLLRCHPWCSGGCDPVPARFPHPAHAARGLFTRLLHRPTDDVS
ncbi:membrane protein insertion efficiency factor YidD [Rubrivivax sp. RP6-9]|uniref:membrane protein insertion efficiency factor YidD n=1 Tax=Rubrivivax sp. RP6-9 TaxID=3415750 RepID=UPI003CC6759C